jgi:preprotein translocase subunit SecE
MARTTIVLLASFLTLGIAGVVAFFAQVIQHLKSKALLPTRKNVMIRALWILLLSALMLAILESESTNFDTLVCAGLLFMGVGALILFAGYFIERQYNQFISEREDG